jgi:PAS domain S-box-containing protein
MVVWHTAVTHAACLSFSDGHWTGSQELLKEGNTDGAAGRDEASVMQNHWPVPVEVLQMVLDASTDPIFNILEDGTYRYVNQAFSRAFGKGPEEIIGKKIWDVFEAPEAEKRMAVVKKAFATGQTFVFDVRVPSADGDRCFMTSVKPQLDDENRVKSVICISKEITERKRVESEREQLIRDLQEALVKVRTLSGLLPICAHCKKVRDDAGYWTRIESYISAHTQAEFSHGICPECAIRAFPEMNSQ